MYLYILIYPTAVECETKPLNDDTCNSFDSEKV